MNTSMARSALRDAIAGGGSLAKYFAEELPKAGLEAVILTRSPKPFFEGKPGVVVQRTTDYSSVDQLASLLSDCDALVSTIQDLSPNFVTTHLNLIAACKQTRKCKRFIPSEFGVDADKYPDQPAYYEPLQGAVRKTLLDDTSDDKLEWTVVCVGGFIDLYVPKANHYFDYMPDMYSPETNSIQVLGTGDERVSLTSARDTARAVAQLLLAPKGSWRPFTYLEGQKPTQIYVLELLKNHAGNSETQFKKTSLTQMIKTVVANESAEAVALAEIHISLVCGAATLDDDKVARDRAEYFSGLVFETVDDVYARLAADRSTRL